MHIESNGLRNSGIPVPAGEAHGGASTDVVEVLRLLSQCPKAQKTPLTAAEQISGQTATAAVFVKDERGRMGLGSFKALGAAYVVARDAAATRASDMNSALAGRTYVAASAGNHGLSVAAGARIFGARAAIYLADTVPEAFAARLRAKGAEVVRAGADYEASMAAAMKAAEDNGWTLLSDSSWPGYTEIPYRVMEGYLAMTAEAADQIEEAAGPPSHILLQAGVGGLAAAAAAHARMRWGDGPVLIVVEPEAAPALQASIVAGKVARGDGPVSCMGRLDCKEPSMLALATLSKEADFFLTISESEARDAMPVLADAGLETTPSGGAALAALLAMGDAEKARLGIGPQSRVLAYLSEGPEQ
ncbi:MAG: pyridoxal-phosphate dependent enzyme [Rhodobiaceae bacterium]|nr:pyridoxal-phosphate dependent enzyme [Rhodobiaceae bacterium]MCC0048369.1 pyridoxal-phosphate dependent enzyme [Rhodobiaceae bacterium]